MSRVPSPTTIAAGHPQGSPTFRPDVEGLRAVAVVVVVVGHLTGLPPGGFVGVDVFFVISGFVITAVLLRELDRSGTISLTAFYARRARRVLPAAVVVILATLVAAAALWFTPRFAGTVLDAVASLSFVQNWHLIAVGADYLGADSPASPLQHFWSLAVEEQFYLIWPVLMLVATSIAARLSSRRARRDVLVGVACAVVVLSVGYAVWRGEASPRAAYFDSVARLWELAAGALCAFARPVAQRMCLPLRRAVVLAGQGVLVLSLVVIDPSSSFPWPWALLPVLGACAIVVGGSGRLGGVETVLVSSPARWVGRRSYSIYLWHFPVIVFAESLGLRGLPAVAGGLVVTLVLSVLTFRFVEEPARLGAWLRGWEAPVDGADRRRDLVRRAGVAGTVTLVVVGMSAAQLEGPAALIDPGVAVAAVGSAPEGGPGPAGASDVPWAAASLSEALSESVLHPERSSPGALDEALSASLVPQLASDECRYPVGTAAAVAEPCDLGDGAAPRTAVLVGDSIALSWLPALEAALGGGWRIRALAFGSCSVTDARFHDGNAGSSFVEKCADSRADLREFAAEAGADLVVTSGSVSGLGRLTSGATGAEAIAEWRRGTETAVSELALGGARVVVIGAPPRGPSPVVCAARPTGAQGCVAAPERLSLDARTAERAGVEDARGRGVDVDFIDVLSWFCAADGECPVVAGEVLIRADAQHLTEAMSRSLGLLLRDELARP
ncbi:peptidoglycan/LPS O-acetylase OafA/YrhL [Frigoribacterium sp. PhB107]|uniref:acyltransferase family protein n=1 Tax=Frigoribacterium sp. PhB107 TaxID=2485172 RepID=UPI000F471939|nr:acyltransferase family protein [Frigoribacterium sp. PhB107]ROP73580.1 peptidoglycan/LPS O-acetylase OafA/YrhL [Frigoribacterium sp. PhB107]